MPIDPFAQYRPIDSSQSQQQTNTRPGVTTDIYGREYDPVNGGWKTPQSANTGWTPNTRTNLMQSGADFSPYKNQLDQLLQDPSKVQQTAGYQFDLDQGNQAINRSAAAKGQLNSGGVLAELAKYGQGMASQEYGNQTNRLADLMRGSQQFGIASGQFRPTTYGSPVQTSNTQWATSSY